MIESVWKCSTTLISWTKCLMRVSPSLESKVEIEFLCWTFSQITHMWRIWITCMRGTRVELSKSDSCPLKFNLWRLHKLANRLRWNKDSVIQIYWGTNQLELGMMATARTLARVKAKTQSTKPEQCLLIYILSSQDKEVMVHRPWRRRANRPRCHLSKKLETNSWENSVVATPRTPMKYLVKKIA